MLFPAVGLAWNFQNEPLLEKARDKWLDEAKFRFSIGQSGRAPSGASVYLGAYVKGTDYMNMSATKQARMQLDNLKWETSTEYNYGLDASVLKGRLRFTFDYYYKTVKDLLQKNYKLPSTTSFGSISYFNSGKMENKGWEFRTDVVIFENKDWRINGYVRIIHQRMGHMLPVRKLDALSVRSMDTVTREYIKTPMQHMHVMLKEM